MRVHGALVGAGAVLALAAAAAIGGPRMLPHAVRPERGAAAAARSAGGAPTLATLRLPAGAAGGASSGATPYRYGASSGAGTAAPPAAAAGPADSAPAADAASGAAGSGGLGGVVVRRVEQTASLTVRVPQVVQAFDAVTALVSGLGGYVVSSALQSGGGAAASANLVVAVPQAQFGSFLKQAGALGSVLDTQVGGQDVTQQYVDLQARITALQAERQSYLTLLGKATAIGDILQIQAQLTDVQSQIEDLTGQLNMLDDLSAMARVTVDLVPPPAAAAVPTPAKRVAAAFRASLHALVDGATALAQAVAWSAPWALLGLAGYAVYRRLARAKA